MRARGLAAFGLLLAWLAQVLLSAQVSSQPPGAKAGSSNASVTYQLPATGPLPRTYLVTLAVVDSKNPDWVLSNFVAGEARTVTAQNQGRFTESWNGLDDNFMPLPPGTYGLKGIYMAADKWAIDGQYHAIIPKLAATAGSWMQTPAEDALPGKVEGDPVTGPLGDVDVAPGGKGSVAFEYLENGRNFFLTDFNKPPGYGEIITGYESGNFAGATSTCTDGDSIWSFSDDGGTKYIGRADGKPFGHEKAGRDGVYIPDGWVTALAAWREPAQVRTVVFDAERGAMVEGGGDANGESGHEMINRVRALDGSDAAVLAQWKVERPLGLAARGARLYILQGDARAGFQVLSLSLAPGWERAEPRLLFKVPAGITPFDLEADHRGRVYLSDSSANHVYQFDAQGRLLRTYGSLSQPVPGHYDPASFLAPEKLACWTDAKGEDRLLVVEMAGPNRLSEWSGDSGRLLRQWTVPQTEANEGYAVDPRHADFIYLQGQRDTFIRWKVDYRTGQWSPLAVWPRVGQSGFEGKLRQNLGRPRVIYRGNEAYIGFGRGFALYHFVQDRLVPCAAVLTERTDPDHELSYIWSDRNGDGRVQEEEYRSNPLSAPSGTLRFFGDTWFDDVSLVCFGQHTPFIWKLAPSGFDARGTPRYDGNAWRKILGDDIFLARQSGHASVLRGANEVGDSFSSDWATIVAGDHGEYYVSARSGPDLSANQGGQFKLSRWVPDGRGGLRQKWRVGRVALEGTARPGEAYGPLILGPPLNGLVGVIDNSRAGVMVYTDEGLYVDTLFPDDHLVGHDQMGAYWQPGEFFAGDVYADHDSGKVYLAMGKTTPQLFEAKGWSLQENPVHALAGLPASLTLRADQIATPPESVLTLRGGAAAARVARFYPSAGGAPMLDGSMRGWEACAPITYGTGAQSVEVRCLYDPEHLYLRWHARTGREVEIPPLGLPEHLFAHDRQGDTLGLYLQGDAQAAAGASAPGGRSSDVRFVFGLARVNGVKQPVVLGMYPSWKGTGAAAHVYRTPAGGSAAFERVALVPGIKAGFSLDADGAGLVLAAALPRSCLPGSPQLDGWRTEGNFDANFGGHNRFWWSDADGSASSETQDEPTEARLYPGAWSPMQWQPMTALPIRSWMMIGPFGPPGVERLDYDKDREAVIRVLFGATFPPDQARDLAAIYDGSETQTRLTRRKLAWQEVELGGDDVADFQKTLAWRGVNDEGTTYLLTHIYTPRAAAVTLNVSHPDGQYAIHGQLNGHALPFIKESPPPFTHLDAAQPLQLQAGWNELLLRRDFIWGNMTLGASLQADPSVLWQIRGQGKL